MYKTIYFSAWIDEEEEEEEKEEEKKLDSEETELLKFDEDATKPELLKKCRALKLPVIPQDRPSSLKRLLKAYELGKKSS